MPLVENFKVESPDVKYGDGTIEAKYTYDTTATVIADNGDAVVRPVKKEYTFLTETKVPKLGVMIVGLGGNNGTTVVGGVTANKHGLTWRTKTGVQTPNYFGSVTQSSTIKVGTDSMGEDVYIPFNKILPMADPNEIVFGGWDISSLHLGQAMERAGVLDYDLQHQLYPHMEKIKPLPGIYIADFIAANQKERADHVKTGSKLELMEQVRKDIRDFKENSGVDQVVIIWSANTERYCELIAGVNDTAEGLMQAVKDGHEEVSASSLYAIASILEGVPYINGAPQNTFVPGLIELAEQHNVPIAGDDFKSGQTKMKSVLVDFLISAGIKPVSIVSYNHLGNNDGRNLSSAKQFRSKEISKSNVVDDMIRSNELLYDEGETPDHLVVIRYVPYVADSKRAMDEYTSEIFCGGKNTIVMHNTCEDSLLAAPIILDLCLITNLMTRIKYKPTHKESEEFKPFHPVLSILSYLSKAPLVPKGAPVINALFKQRASMLNLFRACVGLPPENDMGLEFTAK